MTNYIFLQAVIIVACYVYVLIQFQLASKKHTGTISEIAATGTGIEQLIDKYWNILLAFLCCLFFLGWERSVHIESVAHSGVLLIIVCMVALSVSMFSKLPAFPVRPMVPTKISLYYIFIRTSYLVLYELFFRGLLLQVSLELTGPAMAVAINVALYTIAHIYSPKMELIACIPLGFLFCWLRLEYGSVLFPIILHLCTALPFEIRILRSITHQKIKL